MGLLAQRGHAGADRAKRLHPADELDAQPEQLKNMIEIYQRAGDEARRAPPRGQVRVARMIYLTDSVAQAKRHLRGSVSALPK